MVRKLGYALFALVFLIIMSLPIFAFVLAARGELMVGSDQGSNIRFFLVNSAEAEGIGIQRLRNSSAADDCMQGSVRYLLWEGQTDGLNADYCTCYSEQNGQSTTVGQCTEE